MSIEPRNIRISPSVIATDLTVLGEQVQGFDPAVVDLLHIDVMDGNFVPNLTIGPGYIASLKKRTSIPLDVHLMIETPERSIGRYIEIAPWALTVHYESTRFPARLLQEIRGAGIIAGLTINPATPVESVFDLLPWTDMVLIMSVDPGFYGQAFMEPALERVAKLSSFIRSGPRPETMIQVDGGINVRNIGDVVRAGADIIVAGNSAFSGDDVNARVGELKRIANEARRGA
jgi:ribulose-phosphate 3-epimerase